MAPLPLWERGWGEGCRASGLDARLLDGAALPRALQGSAFFQAGIEPA